MAISNLPISSISPVSPGGSQGVGLGKNDGVAGEFKNQLDLQIQNDVKAEGLADQPSKLEFSNHAVERMRSRGIHYTPDQLQRIESAIIKAADKGAKETLILAEDSAMIVSVKNNKVVTVMDKAGMKDNVFTKIDSTVMI